MNEQVLSKITEQLSGLIESNNFTANDAGDTYTNDRYAFRILHDLDKKMLVLDVAEVNDAGEVGEYKTASSWLFEEEENLRDAESAGLDFLDSLKGCMGIRGVRTGRSGEVAMPRKEAGATPNIEALCVKTLAIFPQFKETYKEHVSHYGSLLYIEFFKSTLTVRVGELLDENNKKSLKKVFSMLCEMYTDGDRAVQNVIVGIVLGGATAGNPTRYQTALEYLEEDDYLKSAFVHMVARVEKDKRFKAMLG